MGYTPHVLVVGGGSTGTGVARDLAMRGLEVTLVERGPLASGTSGSMHSLLHSGARYAVSDPAVAETCRQESRVLREIAGHCIDDVGGLFVSRPEDSAEYFDRKVQACEDAGMDYEVLTGEEVREREPALAGDVERAIAVPDGVVDARRLCLANARSAVQHDATIRTHTTVVALLRVDGAITGARVRHDDLASLEDPPRIEEIQADYVVNATGAWADRLAAKAGIEFDVRYSKGAMLEVAFDEVGTVVNRCRPKTEGDIAVPYGAACILGTTDVEIDDPDDFERTAAEVDLLVDEVGELLPAVRDARPLRAYWGVRTLVDDRADETTDLTREVAILDHEQRDGRWGMTTVVGGKLTTSRLIAERVADHVCAKFGIDRPCLTADRQLPGSTGQGMHEAMRGFGPRLSPSDDPPGRGLVPDRARVQRAPSPILCECEGVTRVRFQDAQDDPDLDPGPDLRALGDLTGAGAGACQGGRCAHRLASTLLPEYDVPVVERAFDTFLQDRWDGMRHALWGDQLATAMSSYAHHVTTTNRGNPVGAEETVQWDRFDEGPADAQAAGGYRD